MKKYIEDYVGERYIFDLRDYNTKFIDVEKLSFLAPEMYREIILNLNESDCLIIERTYKVSYGSHMKVVITSDEKQRIDTVKFNELCERYINTMITPFQKGTEYESQGCKLIKEQWLIPDASYEITMKELVDIFGKAQ